MESLRAANDPGSSSGGKTLSERLAGLQLYHTFELPDGSVVPGFFDLRTVVGKLPIPESLHGKRCLDVASATGFFAIEMARRGGEVVSVDMDDPTRLDWQGPPGVNAARRFGAGLVHQGFDLMCEAYGVEIERHDLSLYDISPDKLGQFDYVFMGNILMHLSDPGRGLRAVRSVIGPGGEFLSFEGISLVLSVLHPISPTAELYREDEPYWWTHNLRGHRRLVEAGGFRVVKQGGPLLAPVGDALDRWPKKVPWRPRDLSYWLFIRRFGKASSWIRAVPRTLEGAET
jgi:SAM-dependent methyltransferase